MGRKGVLFGALLSVVILAVLFMSVDLARVGTEFGRIQYRYFFPLGLILLLGLAIRAYRWELLLPLEVVSDSPRFRFQLFEALTVGFFANAVLPLRAGEFIRAYVVDRWSGIPFPTAFASIVLERIFDVIALLIFLWWVTHSIPDVPMAFLLGAQALGLLACAIVVFILAAYISNSAVLRLVDYCGSRLLPPTLATTLTKFVSDFVAGLRVIRSPQQLVGAFVLSMALWLVIGVFYQLSVYLFVAEADLHTGLLVSVAIALAVAAPSGPGFVGTYQAGCFLALVTLLGRPEEFAVAYSIVTHLFQTVFLTVLGLIIVNRHGLILRDVLRRRAQN